MAKKLQLQVPIPCHEDWEKMTNAQKGRFCSSCQRTVIDFSNMSDREIAMFFKKPSTGSVCGRFMADQLNRDIDIPKKRVPWVKYFFQFLLPGFLISMKAIAQGKVRVVEKETKVFVKNSMHNGDDQSAKYTGSECTIRQGMVAPLSIEPMLPSSKEASVHGKVMDENGVPVPFATVMVKGTKNAIAADSNGLFSLKPRHSSDSICVVVTCVGFSSAEAMLSETNSISNSIILLRAPETSLGEVVITHSVETYRKGMVMSVKTISINNKKPTPVAQHHFNVYPNPMQAGSTLHIEWKQREYGDYSLHLFNQTGQLVFRKYIYIDQEARVLGIDLPLVSAGNYFLRIAHKGTNKSYSEKIIIQ